MQPKRIILLTVFCCFCFSRLFSQANQYFVPAVFPKSPNSAAFAKYGDYQVNLYTGLPDISIPLYVAQSGDISVPITLSYHASGIKVSDVASWVGLGWSLSDGGLVSRRVLGGPDDGDGGFLNDNVVPYSSIDQSTTSGMDKAFRLVKGSIDGRPDIFSYSIPNHLGKFFLNGTDHLFKPVLIPFSPISITYTHLTGSAQKITGFDIRDEHGTRYEFGKTFQEVTNGASLNTSYSPSTTSWMLEKITSQNGRDTVSFDYTPELIKYPDDIGDIATLSDQIDNRGSSTFSTGYQSGTISVSSTSVESKLKSKISFKNGQVIFEKDSLYRQDLQGTGNNNFGLSKIKVYAYNFSTKLMEIQKTVVFYKSYFNPTVSDAKRLKLDSIQILDRAGGIIQHYNFTYNESIAMPPYLTRKKDYWGYYNGKNNTSLIPQQIVDYQSVAGTTVSTIKVGDQDIVNGRDPDSLYMQACVLTDIRYPTGGRTHFEYQTNQYLDNDNVLRLAGGLRVSSIKTYENNLATPIIKTYKYLSARANFTLSYSYFSIQQQYINYDQIYGSNSCPNGAAYKRVRTYVSNSSRDLEPWDASTVVYPDVEEFSGTPWNNTGKTSYTFTDFTDDLSMASMAGTPVVNSYFFRRGQLKSKGDYLRNADGTYQIVRSEFHTYQAFAQKKYVAIGLIAKQNNIALGYASNPIYASTCTSPNDYAMQTFILANYDIRTEDNYPTSVITTIYDQANPSVYQSSTSNYFYDNQKHQQVSRIRSTDSRGNIKVTYNKYPADYLPSLTSTSTNNVLLDSMLNRNMQAETIEKWDSLQNVSTGVNAVTGGQITRYKFGSIVNTIVPDKISRLRVIAPLTDCTPSVISSGNLVADSRYTQMISFDEYDSKNNIIRYTPRNATSTNIIWDYNAAMPTAQVKNAYNPSSPIYSSYAYTSFEAGDKGNWSYSGVPYADATAPTGKMVYDLGTSSISRSNTDLSKPLIISYWSSSGAATVSAGTSIAGVPLRTSGVWTYYEHTIPIGSSPAMVQLSGAVTIDELRMYPAGAQMTTYIYGVDGLTEIADTKSQISRFEYDPAQRLQNIKDWNGNIVKNFGYHNYDMTVASEAQSKTFTRNNCPPYTNPGSASYSIPAGKYYSSTLASANKEAVYDLNTNGQINANTNSGCPIKMVNFTLTNNTGLSGFNATFSGPSNTYFAFNASSTVKTISIPAGVYSISINAINAPTTRLFTLGSNTPVRSPGTTFNNVTVDTGSSTLSLSIQN